MNNIQRIISSLLLAGVLMVPAATVVAAAQDVNVQFKAYDRKHKDYHDWNSDEDQKWHQYQTDNHKKDGDYRKASKKDQDQYWQTRHEQEEKH